MNRSTVRGLVLSAMLPAAAAAALNASATTTQVWEAASFEDFQKGEFEGTVVTGAGEVRAGWDTVRRELEEEGGVWAYAEGEKGDVFLGTGNRGALYLLRGEDLLELAETESVVLTALTVDAKGNLYAAGMPGAVVYRFTPQDIKKMAAGARSAGKEGWKKREYKSERKAGDEEKAVKEEKKGKSGEKEEEKGAEKEKEAKIKGPGPWARLEEADQVWSLLYDPKRQVLFAGTGPRGKIFTIDSTGRVNLYADTEEEHVFSMVAAGEGKIAAGTGNRGRLLLIEGPGRGSVLWDFDATEVRGVVSVGREGGGEAFACAVNKFKSIPSIPVEKPTISKITKAGAPQPSKPPSLEGEGMVAAVFGGGGMRRLFEDKKTHFTSIRATGEGKVLFGDGQKGRVFEVDLEGNYSILFDLEERQVLSFCLGCPDPFIGTSDPAAVHRVLKGPPSSPYYVSEVLDAGFPARWGKMVLRSEGKVYWQARSGNTEKADRWWTDWSKPSSTLPGGIDVKEGRFMQIRLKVPPGSAVWNAKVFYLPSNQQAVVKEVKIGGEEKSKGKDMAAKSGRKEEEKHDPVMELKWEVDNPDGDALRYLLSFAKEGEEMWIPILKEDEKLTETKYKWDTTSIPAGYYIVRVEAADELSNDPRLMISHSRVSKPLLVDNDPPSVWLEVRAKKNGLHVSGKVTDNFSRMDEIQFSVDGKPWKNVYPEDLVFDEQIESFSFDVEDLSAGAHTITVRAWDEARNLSSTGENFVSK